MSLIGSGLVDSLTPLTHETFVLLERKDFDFFAAVEKVLSWVLQPSDIFKRLKLGNYVGEGDSIGSCLLPVYFVPPTLPLSQFSAYFGHSNYVSVYDS